MSKTITILGCGSSGGVPRVGQGWGTCDPANPRNRRLRCSILVQNVSDAGITTVLVDTSPDLREQLLTAHVDWLDGVLYTHQHADHTHGIDDLRGLALHQRKRVDVYADAETTDMLMARFGYCFTSPAGSDYPAILNAHLLHAGQAVTIDGAGGTVSAVPVPVHHGTIDAFGFRFGDCLYTPDLNGFSEQDFRHFESLDLWIIDALREKQHTSHFSLSDALQAIERFKPRRAVLTNMHTDMDFETIAAKLPSHVVPAYDGLQLAIS